MGKQIGLITEVKGIKIKCKLFELLPPYIIDGGKLIQSPRINTLVKTKVGLDTIICQVTGEISKELDGNIEYHTLELDVKGFIESNKFIQGLRLLPIVAATVELLNEKDYEIIYETVPYTSVNLGNDIFDSGKNISVNVNHLIPSHIGVFGNTGSGKSNTLAKILSEYSYYLKNNKNNNSKVLMLDLNNEYGKDAFIESTYKTIYNLKTRSNDGDKIPYDFDKITEDDFIVLLNATEKTQAPVVKYAFINTFIDPKPVNYYKKIITNAITNSRKSLFFSLRNHLLNFLNNVNNFYFHSHIQQFYFIDEHNNKKYLDSLEFKDALDNIEIIIPEDKLDRFFFELCFSVAYENEKGTNIDFIIGLLNRAKKIFSDLRKVFDFENEEDHTIYKGSNIAVIQLANVNNDIREIVPSLLASLIFNEAVEKKGDNEIREITSIVIDEAHNLLYNEQKNYFHDNTLGVFEKVIKEGRKFGVFIYLSSQRPSDISPTIISQLHNYFIHKLVNPSDLSAIRKTVAFLDEKSLDFLTVFSPGECIVSGVAFQMPRFLYVKQLESNNRPNSENVKLVGRDGILNYVSKDLAYKIWEKVYGEATESFDCYGDLISKEDYQKETTFEIDGEILNVGWMVAFKFPSNFGGKFVLDNLQIVSLDSYQNMKDKIRFNYKGSDYEIKKDETKYRIYNLTNNTFVDHVY